MITISAKEARAISSIPATAADICSKIKAAAAAGTPGVDIPGKIPYEISRALSDQGFLMTWKSECKATWVWWG